MYSTQFYNYHGILANYFLSKKQDNKLTASWEGTKQRTIVELPFQQMNSNTLEKVIDTLGDLFFIEASVKQKLLDKTIEDFERTQSFNELNELKSLYGALTLALPAIRQRPHFTVYTLINRLAHQTVSIKIKSHIQETIKQLNKRNAWLLINKTYPNTQFIQNIISISTAQNSYYTRELNSITTFNLATHKICFRNIIDSNSFHFSNSCNPVTGNLAILTTDGNILINNKMLNIRAKVWHHCFSWLKEGILYVNEEGCLAYYNFTKETENVFNELQISKFSDFSMSADLKTCLIICGDRLPSQQILLITETNGTINYRILDSLDSVVTCAFLLNDSENIILATRSRELLLLNTHTGEKQTISARFADNMPVRGTICKITAQTIENRIVGVLATDIGELLVWNTKTNILERRSDFKGIREQFNINALEINAVNKEIILATEKKMEFIPVFGSSQYLTKSPVEYCVINETGWACIANTQAKKIMWFKQGEYVDDYVYMNNEPVALSPINEKGELLVGYRNGGVIKLAPGTEPNDEEAISLFDKAIISIIQISTKRFLISDTTGLTREISVSGTMQKKEYSPIGNIRTEQTVKKLGELGDYVGLGRYHSGDSLFSVEVVRSDNKREIVCQPEEQIIDICTNVAGNEIYVVFADSVIVYNYQRKGWTKTKTIEANVKKITQCGPDLLAVVNVIEGVNWLELWDVTQDEHCITAHELPLEVTSLCGCNKYIGVGTSEGDFYYLKICNVKQ